MTHYHNETCAASLGPATVGEEPYTLATHRDIFKRVASGEIAAPEFKAAFHRLLASETQVKVELNKLTIAELSRSNPHRLKKAQLVERAYNDMLQRFALGQSISYALNGDHLTSMRNAVVAVVDAITDETIQEQASEYRARVEAYQKALANPETLEEFDRFIRMRGKGALTPAQCARYDELLAIRQRQLAKQDYAPRPDPISEVSLGETDMVLQEAFHEKRGAPVWVVTLTNRVESGVFNELRSKAKQFQGWYSSFKGKGAVPGFQFPTREAAETFMGLRQGDVAGQIVQQVREAAKEVRAEQQHIRVARKLRDLADQIEARASQALQAERKTNTARRVSQAQSIEARARDEVRLAQTMRNLADAIESGKTTFLDRVTSRTQVEMLGRLVRSAQNNHAWSVGEKCYQERQRIWERSASSEDIEFARYPYPGVRYSALHNILSRISDAPGARRAALRLRKALQLEKGGTPKEYQRFTDPRDIEAYKTLADKAQRFEFGHSLESLKAGMADYNRLQAMEITTEVQLRAALREYLSYRTGAIKADPIVEAERRLVGLPIPGYFPTPPALVERMLDEAELREGMRVLEPSAGKGNIADLIRAYGVEPEVAEINPNLAAILEAKEYNVIAWDFMDMTPETVYDRIIMNPPFENGRDIDHVLHAYEFLKPGGRLVAIMSASSFFRNDKKAAAFREWLDQRGGWSERNPSGSFKDSERSTGVETYLVAVGRE